jgi:hypothetical protein
MLSVEGGKGKCEKDRGKEVGTILESTHNPRGESPPTTTPIVAASIEQ